MPTGLKEFTPTCRRFFNITVDEIDSWGWVDTLTLYQKAVEFTRPRLKLPYLENPEKKIKDEPFDYPQRLWYSFAHLLASNYHWQIEIIEELDIEDALAMIQEILIDLQLKREWEHSLSPLAYYSDTKNGESRFHPLPRPAWMIAEQKVRLVRMPKSALPVGNVQGLGEEFENAILAKGK